MKKICLCLCSRFPFVIIFLFCHKMQILLFRLSYFSSVRKNILNTFSRQTNHTMQIVDNSNILSCLLANYYFRYHKFKLYNKLTILYFKKSALPLKWFHIKFDLDVCYSIAQSMMFGSTQRSEILMLSTSILNLPAMAP